MSLSARIRIENWNMLPKTGIAVQGVGMDVPGNTALLRASGYEHLITIPPKRVTRKAIVLSHLPQLLCKKATNLLFFKILLVSLRFHGIYETASEIAECFQDFREVGGGGRSHCLRCAKVLN